ncbi:MAG: nucleotidyltransferase [Alphaproteobacteria bacterium]|nr:nucleotidyltransferase [Alphaproteobacteria bacterium]
MTVSSYLKEIADNAVLSVAEKDSIVRSEVALKERLGSHFGADIKKQFRFGSYDRGTILPRVMDQNSDVDYMIVFESGFRPQTYLDKLRRFVDGWYTKSQISQSHPVIKLELNHIRFELVPAIETFFYGLSIPKKDGTEDSWISTDPKDANSLLIKKNGENNYLIKPLVRLVKYWNACNGYVYDSFVLETEVLTYDYSYLGFFPPKDLKNCFFEFMKSRPELWQPQRRTERVQKAKKIIGEVRSLEKSGQWAAAEEEIRKLIPPVGVVSRRSLLG